MFQPLKIVMIASECVPFVKTGGLADVVGALPKALKALGHDVRIILPKYKKIDVEKHELVRLQENMGVWMGNNVQEWCSVDQTTLGDGIPVYFIEFMKYFDRDGLYNDDKNVAYEDNAKRFTFFTRAALQLCIDRRLDPDIVHVHDWQTASAAAYLKTWFWDHPTFRHTASALTIHNINYQGIFPKSEYSYTGLSWDNFKHEEFEDHGNMNLLKGGIALADMVNTVSPTYAVETSTTKLGSGMQGPLSYRGDRYLGILNGVDYDDWDPRNDKLIPANFSADDLSGKVTCKEALQEQFGLEPNPDIPIVGVVSRFAQQKGLDILYDAIHNYYINHKNAGSVQFVVLGSGDKRLEGLFMGLPNYYPGMVGTYVGYDNKKAHWIEAGADFFAMPSHFEPCGLNQMYSLRYGTLPIVRSTGGLADTIDQYDESSGLGTGFKYWDNHRDALASTIAWAVSTYHYRPSHIDSMVQRAMHKDFGWENSAKSYLEMYRMARYYSL